MPCSYNATRADESCAFLGKQIFKPRYRETGKIAHIDTMHRVHLPFVACLAGIGKAFFVFSMCF